VDENQKRIVPQENSWPRGTFELPWARNCGGGYERPLGSEEEAFLDYIMVQNRGDPILRIPSRPDYVSYPLHSNHLELTIRVGSRGIDMKPSIIRFTFTRTTYDLNTDITELENTSPQVSDTCQQGESE